MSDHPQKAKSVVVDQSQIADGKPRDLKAERLAAALRANLKRRKTADRARRTTGQGTAADDEAP